ncbi:MAG: DUF2911 domain-containing protein, partial [Verrucomicrobia bacterium]|nr:DUF2911 domain-containing protein [Verrucomicrobiota bacterium]
MRKSPLPCSLRRAALAGGVLFSIISGFPAAAPRAQAQDAAPAQSPPRVEFPAPSPHTTLKQRVGVTDIEVDYSRPSARGRKIFGDLVPYGQVWRTGANASTKITFGDEVKFGDKPVPAGKYALYTIPGADEWTVILSKDTSLWGAYKYKPENDLLRI